MAEYCQKQDIHLASSLVNVLSGNRSVVLGDKPSIIACFTAEGIHVVELRNPHDTLWLPFSEEHLF